MCAVANTFNSVCRCSMCVLSQMMDSSWKVFSVQNRHCLTRRFWSVTGGSMWNARPPRSSTTVIYPSQRVTNLWRHWHSFHHTTRANVTVNKENVIAQWTALRFTASYYRPHVTERLLHKKLNNTKPTTVAKKAGRVRSLVFCMTVPSINITNLLEYKAF